MTTFFHQTRLIFWAQLRDNIRNPLWVVIGLMQPVLYLVLFGPLLENLGASFSPDLDPWLVFTPGMLMMIALFGSMFAGFSLIMELRAGVIERQRVTPASRGALLLGRVAKDMVVLIVQALVLTAVAVLAFGLRPSASGAILALLLVSVVAAGMSSASYALALRTRSEESLASVLNSVSVPLLLLSGILLPMTLAPGWLETLSRLNPLAHTVDATRALFAGDVHAPEVLFGGAVTAALAATLAVIGARTFRRENA